MLQDLPRRQRVLPVHHLPLWYFNILSLPHQVSLSDGTGVDVVHVTRVLIDSCACDNHRQFAIALLVLLCLQLLFILLDLMILCYREHDNKAVGLLKAGIDPTQVKDEDV